MKFLLWLALWSVVAFVPAWFLLTPWQHALASIAGRLVAPPGAEIEFTDLQVYYPLDIGVFVALCLASTWAPRERRLKSIAIGVAVLVGIELLSLVIAMKAMLGVMMRPGATEAAAEEVQRFAVGVIRAGGLVASAAVWVVLLGRERLSLAARTWLGT
jgi:hypothetical protein